MKVCTRCGVKKPRSEYYKDRSRRDGLCDRCRVCKLGDTQRSRARSFKADPWGYLLAQKRYQAKRDRIKFTLTREWLEAQNLKRCPYTGIPFRLTKHGVGQGVIDPLAPTFDRIYPKEGYTPDNTEIVSWRVNCAKRSMHPEEFEWLCRCVVETIDSRKK